MPIDLWAARLERPLTEEESEDLLHLLPSQRRERLLRLRESEKRREPLCAYLLLRLALRKLYGWRDLPDIALTDRGKPWFPDCLEVHFNLSHTTGAVLVGISDQELGVDIERIRPLRQRTVAQLAGTVSEAAFFESWVRREARTKRSGDGIGAMMRAETPLQQGEYYYKIETFPGYAAGAAAWSKDRPQGPHRYSLDEMLRSL